MSSPRMNNVIIVGGLLTYLSVILFGIDGKIIPEEYMHIMCWVSILTPQCNHCSPTLELVVEKTVPYCQASPGGIGKT